MEQMEIYVNIDEVYPNRGGCRPGKLETDRGMKERSRHKLSAPIVYSLLGFSILLSAAALSVAVILYFRMADPGSLMGLSQWKRNVTGSVQRVSSSLAELQAEISQLKVTGSVQNVSSSPSELQTEISQLKDLNSCPHAWAFFKQSCYLFSSSSKTWEEAKDSCMSAQAHLVVVNDAEEQDFLRKQNQVTSWIGLSDKVSEGDWRWVDGTDYISSVKFWETGEPNNANDEDCAELYRDGNWNDRSCNAPRGWICEKPAQ